MEILNWFGRFHPALVHLPIGILIIGVILQFLARRRPDWQLEKATQKTYLVGFLSAVVAALAGWFLAREGGYEASTIFWHRWLGILMVLLSFFLYWNTSRSAVEGPLVRWGGIALVLGLLYVGHLGGVLTHGETYLVENAPKFVQRLASYKEGAHHPQYQDPEQTMVYDQLIQPFLEEKCWTCHDANLLKGGLDMSTQEGLLEGGRNGAVIEASADNSELFKRVIMDPSRKKFMPPKGDPLSYQEIKLLEWWINSGAPFDQAVTAVETPDDIKAILLARHQLDTKPKSFLEKTQVEPVPADAMEQIAAKGFTIKPIAMNSNFVDVSWNGADSISVNDMIEVLQQAQSQIAWLDLGNSSLQDASLATVGKLTHLIRLKIDNNPITDDGIKFLSDLEHLESLNLYATKISDICAPDLKGLENLQKLFVWQTDFSESGINQLKTALPEVEIVAGYTLAQPAVTE